ncbi:hypothetical protein N9274_02250 [Akkermansiaceae bacterium]|nr:hypothetical protein [Akkermansiaceae bacterium]
MKTFFFFLTFLIAQSSSAEIGINPTAKTFAKEGGGGAIFVSGTGSWEASSASPWITVFTPVGNGQGTVAYLVSLNNSADTRQGTILVSDKIYTITQNGYDSSISPTSTSVAEGGGSGVVSVTVGPGISWTAVSDVDWIQVDSAGGLSSGQVNYTVEAYEGVQPRFGSITIAGNTFDVTQTGGDLALSPSSASLSYGATAIPNIGVEALASTSWSVVSNATWISVVDAGRGFGDSAITLGVGENPSYLERVGTVSVGSKTFTVTQEGTPNLRLEINPTEATADASGAIGNVAVLATPDAPWTSESLAPWITVSGGSTGAGNGNISYVVSPNTNLEERIGQIKINPPVPPAKPDLDKGLLFEVYGAEVFGNFKIIEGRYSWQEAKLDAEARGGRLAVLDTQDKIDAASIYLSGLSTEEIGGAWIGLTNNHLNTGSIRNRPDEYLWVTGQGLSASNWHPGTPNNAGGGATGAALRKWDSGSVFGWDDDSIDTVHNYLLTESTDSNSRGPILGGEFDLSGWARSKGPDNHLEGPSLQRQTDAFSMVVDFNVEALDSIKRLSEVTRPDGSYCTIWVNSSNEVVFRSGSEELKSIPLPATGNYRAYVTASESNDVNLVILSAPTGAADPVIISSGSEQFSQPPFPVDIELGDIRLKESNVPSVGQLRDAFISGYKLYERALTQKEIEKYRTNDEAYVPDEPAPTQHFNLNGSGVSSKNNSLAAITDMISVPDRFGVEGSALKSNGDGYVRISSSVDTRAFSSWLRFDSVSDQRSVLSNFASEFSLVGPNGYSYQSAQADAASRGGRLAVLNSPEKIIDARAVYQTGSQQDTWIGLSKDSNGVFRWINGEILQEPAPWSIAHSPESAKTYAGFWGADKGKWITFTNSPTERSYGYLLEGNYNGNGFSIANGFLTIGGVDVLKVPKSQWLHFAVTVGTDGFKQIFINGEEIFSTKDSFDLNLATQFKMRFDGAVDMVSTYGYALSPAQIRSIYESQKPETYFHTITQEAFQPSVEPAQASVSSSGGSASTNLILSGNVQWTATTTTPWLNITSSTTGAGSAEIRVVASRNPTVYERTGTVLVAGQTFSVIQPGLNVDLEYEQPIFRAAGGDLTIDVATEAGAAWEVSTDADWIIPVLPAGGSAFGSGSAFIIVAGYSDTTSSRSGILNIAGKEVVISQRGYDLSVSPQVAEVGSNAGAGEFGVTAPLTAVWEAIVTEPWITLIGGQDGRGNGTVRYSLGSNTTGAPRTGKVIVSGEEYLITQYAGIQVTVNAASDGTASGSGSYDTNEVAILTAEADPGYVFSHWTGDGVGSDNPLELIVDSVKSVTANFIPESAVTQFQQPIFAELAVKDQVIAQKDNQIQTGTITIANLQSGIDALAAANVELQQSYNAVVIERDARPTDSDGDGLTDEKEEELETDPQEVTAFYLEAADPLAIETARLAGRSEVLNAPQNFNLYTSSQYNSVVTQRDARPTDSDGDGLTDEKEEELGTDVSEETVFYLKAAFDSAVNSSRQLGRNDVTGDPASYSLIGLGAYNTVVVQRDARPTQAAFDSAVNSSRQLGRNDVTGDPASYSLIGLGAYNTVVVQRDARPTQAAFDSAVNSSRQLGRNDVTGDPASYSLVDLSAYSAVVAQRDARPTQVQCDVAALEALTEGRNQVRNNPTAYQLTTLSAYNLVVSERDARPTLAEIQDARPGAILLTPNQDGMIEFKLDIEETNDLEAWSHKGKSVEAGFPLEPGKKFFRFSLQR